MKCIYTAWCHIFYILAVAVFGHVSYNSHRSGMCMGMWTHRLYRWTIARRSIISLRAHRPCIQRIYHIDREQRIVHLILSIVPYKRLAELPGVYPFDQILLLKVFFLSKIKKQKTKINRLWSTQDVANYNTYILIKSIYYT